MKKIALLMFAAALFVACGQNREERLAEIKAFEDSIFESPIAADTATANRLTELYVNFVNKYPKDSVAPEFLMKAADIQSNVLHTERAVGLFDRVIEEYPDFEDVPMCYFLKGNAYELNSQYDKAKATYELFLDKFPDHYMAEQTRTLIPLIGMSPEEMLDAILANANDTIIAQNNF